MGMLSPSFCQVMLGRGTPEASQGSTTSSSAKARTKLGSGFTMGEATKEWGCRGSWARLAPRLLEPGGLKALKGTGLLET